MVKICNLDLLPFERRIGCVMTVSEREGVACVGCVESLDVGVLMVEGDIRNASMLVRDKVLSH